MDVILLAAVAVYIFIKLKKQLGRVDEDQKRDAIRNFIKGQTIAKNSKNSKNLKNPKNNVVNIIDGKEVENDNNIPKTDPISQKILDAIDDEEVKQNLTSIVDKIGTSAAVFISGTNKAFEIIIESFAQGDSKALRPLLSEKIMQQFQLAIQDRVDQDKILNTKIVAIDESKVIAAKIVKNYFSVTIKFISRQINYITDKEGTVIDGSKEQVNIVNDIWTLKKNIRSKNPNWFVSATAS